MRMILVAIWPGARMGITRDMGTERDVDNLFRHVSIMGKGVFKSHSVTPASEELLAHALGRRRHPYYSANRLFANFEDVCKYLEKQAFLYEEHMRLWGQLPEDQYTRWF